MYCKLKIAQIKSYHMQIFEERRVSGEKHLRAEKKTNKQTQPTYDAKSGNRNWATLVVRRMLSPLLDHCISRRMAKKHNWKFGNFYKHSISETLDGRTMCFQITTCLQPGGRCIIFCWWIYFSITVPVISWVIIHLKIILSEMSAVFQHLDLKTPKWSILKDNYNHRNGIN